MPDTLSIDMQRIHTSARKAAALLRMLANENRMLLMCQLSQGEKSVSELETLLHIRQPTLSQQLGILRESGLVATRRNGKQIIYRVSNANALEVIQTLYKLYCHPAKT